MRYKNEIYGEIAGKIWKALSITGPCEEKNLLEKTGINKNEFYAGVGWLARENKIHKRGTTYQLGDTNLTNEIGTNAGKVWNTLNNTQDIDVSTITKISHITQKDAYSAIGWLAREDKIKTYTKDKILKFELK